MFNQVKKSLVKPIVSSLVMLSLMSTPILSHAEDCDLPTMVKELKKSFGERFKNTTVNKEATLHGKRIKAAGLDKDYAYMVDWKLKRENQTGPWAMKGNTLIHGVTTAQRDKWMEKIGMKSFGLGFQEHPWDIKKSLTGVLRVRDKIFKYYEIQRETSFNAILASHFTGSIQQSPWAEATFMASDEELDAIIKFLEDRVENRITALKSFQFTNRDQSYAVEAGQPLRPVFNITESTIGKESCAGACSSMFHPDWLSSYGSPRALTLATMSVERGLRNHSSAKAYVFSNFRNPNTSAITILGVDGKYPTGQSFVNDMEWGQLGGMMWGFIPDRPAYKASPNYTTQRTALQTWLDQH